MLVHRKRRQPQVQGEFHLVSVFVEHRRQGLVTHLDHGRGKVPTIGGSDNRHRRRCRGQIPRPPHLDITDPGQPQPPVGPHREPARVQPDHLPSIPLRFEPRCPDPAAGTLTGQRVEEVLVRGIAVADGLLQHDVRRFGQPPAFGGVLRLSDQPLLQHGAGRVFLPGSVGVVAGTHCIVVDHTSITERLTQRLTLPVGGIQPIPVPQLHTHTIDHQFATLKTTNE
ncbi:hypothetical protein FHX42_002827 [Saccharopolyspora lacisalsi]|uniref:Uncharacterized protein n=1 Tax=Halosaccharopolyspora lacisalsi TaxID=1000566 RepID=A0A839DZ15_9PSEU|nr:hypothetical protein [Halosaccharopolyspora lacisalsi]